MNYTVMITGPDLKPLTDPVPWSSLDLVLRHNQVGSGVVAAPAQPQLLTALGVNRPRVVVRRDDRVLISGPVEKPGSYKWTAADHGGGPGTIEVAFADNLVWLARRRVYPNPAQAATAQTTAYYTATGVNAETLSRTLVNVNAGPGALAARQVTGVALGAVAGVGTPVNLTGRFEPLTDALRTIAFAGGGLGFRLVDTGTALQFEVYAPRDRTKHVRYSRALGNLRDLSTSPDAPTCTVALVGGTGVGASRTVVERIDAAAVTRWGRIEAWVDQRGVADTTGLVQYGDQALTEGAEKVGLTAVAVDTAHTRLGLDYWLGDRVAVELANGVQIADLVHAVKVTATPDEGEVIMPVIGQTDPTTNKPTTRAIREMLRRLGQLERT